jgi:3-hydroxybutyryl-CoA dehydratase
MDFKCNTYSFDDISIGMTEQFECTVTQEMQDAFTALSGDINPMHTDTDFARVGGYQGKLVYGMLTASFYSKLVGVYLPGEKCLFRECNVQWPSPVYIGDTLTVVGKVSEIDSRIHTIKIKAFIRNQNGKKVSRATLTVGVLD